jgi:hypothetical protein
MSVGRRELGGVPQGGNRGAARNVKVIGITIEFDSRPKGTTIMKVKAQVLDIRENT